MLITIFSDMQIFHGDQLYVNYLLEIFYMVQRTAHVNSELCCFERNDPWYNATENKCFRVSIATFSASRDRAKELTEPGCQNCYEFLLYFVRKHF